MHGRCPRAARGLSFAGMCEFVCVILCLRKYVPMYACKMCIEAEDLFPSKHSVMWLGAFVCVQVI